MGRGPKKNIRDSTDEISRPDHLSLSTLIRHTLDPAVHHLDANVRKFRYARVGTLAINGRCRACSLASMHMAGVPLIPVFVAACASLSPLAINR
tara:strand:+ start:21420 stop:21701 length:282 start_codon:yes stop_codon:yes gene_type:complete